MAKTKILLDNVEKSLLINSIIISMDTDRFTEEEREILKSLKKRLQEGK